MFYSVSTLPWIETQKHRDEQRVISGSDEPITAIVISSWEGENWIL